MARIIYVPFDAQDDDMLNAHGCHLKASLREFLQAFTGPRSVPGLELFASNDLTKYRGCQISDFVQDSNDRGDRPRSLVGPVEHLRF